jgi:hypothetical protein
MTLKYKNIIHIEQNTKRRVIFSKLKINNVNLNYLFFFNYILKLNKPIFFITNINFFKKINDKKKCIYLY